MNNARVNQKKEENKELEKLLHEKTCRTRSELADEFWVTQQVASEPLRTLERIHKQGRYVLRVFSLENKARRHDTAMSLLPRFKKNDSLHNIVTYDG